MKTGDETDTGKVETHDHVLLNISELPDGFRGIFEAPDGFRGTYEEVVAHELNLGMKTGEKTDAGDAEKQDQVLLRIHEAADGFRGSYEEVVAHEKRLGLATGSSRVAASTQGDVNNKVSYLANAFNATETLLHFL